LCLFKRRPFLAYTGECLVRSSPLNLNAFSQLRKNLVIVWLTFLSIPASLSDVKASDRDPADYEWREVGRTATIALNHKNYDQAILLYRRAIALRKPESFSFDINANLKLSLAETLRRQGKFTQSKVILDELEPQIEAHPDADAMLPARYWRRRSKLLKDEGMDQQAAEALQRSVSVVAKYIPANNKHFIVCWRELAWAIPSGRKQTNDLVDCLRLLRNSQGKVLVSPLIKTEYDSCVSTVLINAIKQIVKQDFSGAAGDLQALSEVDKDYRVIGAWWLWMEWFTYKANGNVEPAIRSVRMLLPQIQKSGNLKAEADAHYCLACAYDHQHKSAMATEERKKVDESYKQLLAEAASSHRVVPSATFSPINAFSESIETFQLLSDRRKFDIYDIAYLRKVMEASPAMCWPLYADVFSSVLKDVWVLIEQKKFDSSADLLDKVAECGGGHTTLNHWWAWISGCHQNREPGRLERAGASLRKLLPALRQSGNRLAELEAHYLLMQVYELGLHPENAPAQWRVMNDLFRKLRVDKSVPRDKLLDLIVTHHIEHLRLRLLYEKDASSVDERLKQLEFWTEMFPGAEKNTRFLTAHKSARSTIAKRALLKDKQHAVEKTRQGEFH
jgi:tetratricopeptide (TPR) repeat protein